MNKMGFYGPLKISFFDRPAIMVDPSHRQHRYSLGFIPSMEKQSPKPVCGQEALQLLNCVTESSFDEEKCLRFLQSLRECVLSQVRFMAL